MQREIEFRASFLTERAGSENKKRERRRRREKACRRETARKTVSKSRVLSFPCNGRCPIKSLVLATPIKTLLNIHSSRVYRRQSEIQIAPVLLSFSYITICSEQTRSRFVIKLTLIIRTKYFFVNYGTYLSRFFYRDCFKSFSCIDILYVIELNLSVNDFK